MLVHFAETLPLYFVECKSIIVVAAATVVVVIVISYCSFHFRCAEMRKM